MNTITAKQIHSEFDTASDSLTSEAFEFLAYYDGKLEVIRSEKSSALSRIMASENEKAYSIPLAEKARRLRALGFANVKEVTELTRMENQEREQWERQYALKRAEEEKYNKIIAELKADEVKFKQILNYREHYPAFKFITDEQLNGLCKKYGLVYAEVGDYTGDMPDKNLAEIESANIAVGDARVKIWRIIDAPPYSPIESITEVDLTNHYNKLHIAAPQSQFKNLEQREKVGFGFFNRQEIRVEVKDPIVFRFVKGGVLVISKWGDEANDPALAIS
jgi:hypothetical protein